MPNINYTYRHCSKEDFANEVSFDEKVFSEKLSEAFELENNVERIDVVFEIDKGQSNNKFSTTINVVSPKLGMTIVEKGEDEAKIARLAVDKTIQEIHKLNNKLTEHK